jgi:hypothetical protein
MRWGNTNLAWDQCEFSNIPPSNIASVLNNSMSFHISIFNAIAGTVIVIVVVVCNNFWVDSRNSVTRYRQVSQDHGMLGREGRHPRSLSEQRYCSVVKKIILSGRHDGAEGFRALHPGLDDPVF